MQKLLDKYLRLASKQGGQCAGVDLSIIKYSTCASPYDPGGFAFGGGGPAGPPPPGSGPPPGGPPGGCCMPQI